MSEIADPDDIDLHFCYKGTHKHNDLVCQFVNY